MINTSFDISMLKSLINEMIKEHNTGKEQSWNDDILTEDEACKFLKICRPTLGKLRKEKKVKYMKVGKGFRYRRSYLLQIGK